MIGQDTLDRIRRETDLVALISESLKLVRRGRSFVGLCPFHKEKSPSFHVNPERGFYHCFGCHASGDAIKFVQENEGLEFIESVKRLAERAGIEVDLDVSDVERRQQHEARRRSDELYEVTSLAAAWFERMLHEHPLAGYAEAELERRELVPKAPTDAVADALQAFRVGYAPYGWEALAQHLREQKASLVAAERVGLLGARKTGSGYYDRFRHRLMFAVLDIQGRVIAFSGRALDDPSSEELAPLGLPPPQAGAEKPAKYYNSPESPIYKKREALFGLYQARAAIRTADSCVLVEGNFDVLSLHARGIKNVVAPLGTAFTTEQGQQLRRFCPNVVLLFDGDDAGRRAVRATRDVAQKIELSAKVASLPSGVDPDDLVRREGRAGIERVVGAARGLLEHLIHEILEENFADTDASLTATRVKEIRELVESEPDPTERAVVEKYATAKLAQRLNTVNPGTLRALQSEMTRALAQSAGNRSKESAPAPVAAPFKARSPEHKDAVALEILGTLLDFPELFQGPEAIEVADILEGDAAAALAALRQGWEQDGLRDVELVLAKLAPSIHAFARARLAAPRHMQPKDAQAELSGNVRRLKALALKRDKQTTVEQLERARPSGDSEQQFALLEEHFRKARQRRAVAPE